MSCAWSGFGILFGTVFRVVLGAVFGTLFEAVFGSGSGALFAYCLGAVLINCEYLTLIIVITHREQLSCHNSR